MDEKKGARLEFRAARFGLRRAARSALDERQQQPVHEADDVDELDAQESDRAPGRGRHLARLFVHLAPQGVVVERVAHVVIAASRCTTICGSGLSSNTSSPWPPSSVAAVSADRPAP